MTVSELARLLGELEAQGHGDKKVLFAYQETYPLQDEIQGVWVPGEDDYGDPLPAEDWDEESMTVAEKKRHDSTIYIVSGGQCYDMPYGPRDAFRYARNH